MNEPARTQLLVLNVRARNGFTRRMFFATDEGAADRLREVAQIAEAYAQEDDPLSTLCERVAAIASEHGLRQVAR